MKLKSSLEKYAGKIGWFKRIFKDEFPIIKVEASRSMIDYVKQVKKYWIKSSSNLTYKFSITGEKKISFTTRDNFSFKSSENISNLCGVIVESNFKFENDDVEYKQMLIHIGYDNESTPCYLFHFFKTSNECYQYLYSGEKYLDYESTILPEDYIIPFDKMFSSVYYDHPNESKIMIKIRYCLVQLFNKFEKDCNDIKISDKFKVDLLLNIKKYGILNNLKIFDLHGLNYSWEYYSENNKD